MCVCVCVGKVIKTFKVDYESFEEITYKCLYKYGLHGAFNLPITCSENITHCVCRLLDKSLCWSHFLQSIASDLVLRPLRSSSHTPPPSLSAPSFSTPNSCSLTSCTDITDTIAKTNYIVNACLSAVQT